MIEYSISSVTMSSLMAMSLPFFLARVAVRPAGLTCIPAPYAEMSTCDPGVSPRESRSALGSRTRPPESIVARMGLHYHCNPTVREPPPDIDAYLLRRLQITIYVLGWMCQTCSYRQCQPVRVGDE